MEAWSILEFTQGQWNNGTMPLCSAVRRFFCSIRTFLTQSYCADWTLSIEDYGLISISVE